MAKLVFGMNQSLDGYVDHLKFAPGPILFRHFIKEAEGQAGSLYGRNLYELMVTGHVTDHAARLRSYEIVAEARARLGGNGSAPLGRA